MRMRMTWARKEYTPATLFTITNTTIPLIHNHHTYSSYTVTNTTSPSSRPTPIAFYCDTHPLYPSIRTHAAFDPGNYPPLLPPSPTHHTRDDGSLVSGWLLPSHKLTRQDADYSSLVQQANPLKARLL
ncbi:unnamed protein product [Periconia digitata]|uniref:Uncharacterized protein n=1 Tax=Periconia digitata TaxID=1303443 RepID=A0A9W4UNY3_9PLEO|nr:unnamed protein product [Periconia digitata]